MGIFKDFATSAGGDVTLGVFQGIGEVAERDAKANAVIADQSLAKENKAFATTELAYKNFDQIKNIVSNNLEAFNIKPMGNFSESQLVDMYVGKAFKEQRSIFENNDFNKVKMGFANYVARTPGEDFSIDISSPYVASEDKFEREKDMHAEKLSAISKMPNADKLLMNLRKIEEGSKMTAADQMGDAQLKIASITAKGYGILNTFPGTAEGNANLNFMKVNIIVANSKAKFPNDASERSKFIDQKLYENNINPLDALNYQSPISYKAMASVIDQTGINIANQIANNINAIASGSDKDRETRIQQNNNLLLSQHKLIDTFSASATKGLSGRDRSTIFPVADASGKTTEFVAPKAPQGYVPQINRRGAVILPGGGELPLDNLFANYEVNKKALAPEIMQFVEPLRRFFDDNGMMIAPKREMFAEGKQGDVLFDKFRVIYNRLTPPDQDDLATLGGYGMIDSRDFEFAIPKVKTFIDPSNINTLKVTDNNKKESKSTSKKKLGEKTFIYKGKSYNVPKKLESYELNEGLKKYIADDLDPDSRKLIDSLINKK